MDRNIPPVPVSSCLDIGWRCSDAEIFHMDCPFSCAHSWENRCSGSSWNACAKESLTRCFHLKRSAYSICKHPYLPEMYRHIVWLHYIDIFTYLYDFICIYFLHWESLGYRSRSQSCAFRSFRLRILGFRDLVRILSLCSLLDLTCKS